MTWDTSLQSVIIPVGYSRLAAHCLQLSEKNLHQLTANTGLSSVALLRDDTLLSGEQQIQVLVNACELAELDGFGLDYGKKLTPPMHGPLGFLVNSSPTLIGALTAFNEYLPLRMHLTRIAFEITDDYLECKLEAHPEIVEHIYRVFIEALSLTMLSIASSILDRPLTEGLLMLKYPAPAYYRRYDEFYPCEVRFGAKANILRIPVELIHTKNISAEFQNYEHALEQCKELLAIAAKDQTATHARVRRSLLSNPSHQVSESEVAAALFVGKRTLARRLEREGTSFRQVRDEVLSSLAEGYLLNTQLSVEAVAALLNYHDSSSFRRAFKRWNKVPPEQFRKNAAKHAKAE